MFGISIERVQGTSHLGSEVAEEVSVAQDLRQPRSETRIKDRAEKEVEDRVDPKKTIG